ncbi:MAG: protein tyrosine phosphatase [Parvularculaceae bacterium]|jgi:predicted protein tyrosine phosphatase|nr:protein tyrosine phosphatase [Parvularculaceae bacterium]
MTIWVSSLYSAPIVARRVKPRRAVSLLSPEDSFPALPGVEPVRHHRVHIHDINEEMDGFVSPGHAHVEAIVDFLGDHGPDETILIHCWAGISRSTATAFIAACLHNPQTDEAEIAEALRLASPTAFPNRRMVAFADEILDRRGRMKRAINEMAPGVVADEAEPFSLPTRFGA